MDILLYPKQLQGDVTIIPSKSMAHRLLICAAFADAPTQLHCAESNRDIDATAECLCALGATVLRTETGFTVIPAKEIPHEAVLNCCESGSTLRFLLPVAGALGVTATFQMEGRLPDRPLSPLWEEMERMGCCLSRPTANTILCCGKLRPGDYRIRGNVSSQYITGLSLALSLLDSPSTLTITGKIESMPYIQMTNEVLSLFGVDPGHPGGHPLRTPGYVSVEGDWSNGAFWLAANALGSRLSVMGLKEDSVQGDRAAVMLLEKLCHGYTIISAADIPDLIPILSVVAGFNYGAMFTDIQRLRIKESDRVASVIAMIESLGGTAYATEETLTVCPGGLTGGRVDAVNDHRIAMSAAIAATACTEPVQLHGAEAVNKSYPQFWAEYARLGGNYEQYLR